MKKTVLLFLLAGWATFSIAQDDAACQPDTAFIGTQDLVVSPFPFDPETMEGGIEAFPACIGEPYSLVFSFRIGDSTEFNGLALDLIQASVPVVDGVQGLPEGLNYFCNPPDCIFPDTVLGCIIIEGTPTEGNMAGTYPLVLQASLEINGFQMPLTTTIPGDQVSGEYNLVLNEMGACATSSLNNVLARRVQLVSTPNPVVDRAVLEVESTMVGTVDLAVFDLTGRTVLQQPLRLFNGTNRFDLDLQHAQEGMYIYTLRSDLGSVSEKLIVSRR